MSYLNRDYQHSFQPQTSKSQIFSSKRLEMTFMERLALDCEKREYREKLNEYMNDPRRVRRRAVPIIGRGPELERPSIDVGLHLYESAFISAERRRRNVLDRNKQIKQRAEGKKTNEISHQIMESLFERSTYELFSLMDSDNDGLISAKRISISNVDPKKLVILAPFLVEMEQQNIVLNLDTFSDALRQLLNAVSLTEKNLILGINQKKRVSTGGMEDCTFAPKINSKSRKIVSRAVSRKSANSIKHGCLKTSMQKIQSGEDKECTFHPKINKDYVPLRNSAYKKR